MDKSGFEPETFRKHKSSTLMQSERDNPYATCPYLIGTLIINVSKAKDWDGPRAFCSQSITSITYGVKRYHREGTPDLLTGRHELVLPI